MHERTKNSAKNFSIGMLWQATYVLLMFVVRWTLVRELGIGSASLNGLFTEMIAMLSLAELGVGSAITYHLYKPLAEHDEAKLTQLMTLFRNAYRIIALLVFAVGMAFLPVIPFVIQKADFDPGYIRLVYSLFVFQTAVSYLFSYKSSLLSADQRQRSTYLCNMVSFVLFSGIEILVLFLFQNFIVYLVADVFRVIFQNVLISRVADKRYPFLKKTDKLPTEERKDIFSNIKNLFVSKICARITTSTDNLLISVIVGTLVVGQYSQYAMLFNGVFRVFDALRDSTAGSVGNSMVSESPEKCRKIMDRMTLLSFFLGSPLTCCLFVLSTVFVQNIFGPEYVIGWLAIAVTAFNFFYSAIKIPLQNYVEVSGRFAENRNIAIVGTVFNLIISIVLALFIGLPGIFIGTTATIVIQTELRINLLKKCGIPMEGFRFRWEMFCLLGIAEMAACYVLFGLVQIPFWIVQFLVGAVICIAVPVLVNIVLFRKSDEFAYIKSTMRAFLKRGASKKQNAAADKLAEQEPDEQAESSVEPSDEQPAEPIAAAEPSDEQPAERDSKTEDSR